MSQKRNHEHIEEQSNTRFVSQRFVLNDSIKQELRLMKPNFGFNGLGELVFRRTYSRDNEDWCDVVIRVIEGVMSIRKEHFYRNSLYWSDEHRQSFAREMAISMFKMEWLPPGRGLWMMGTDFVYERGSMALFNCFTRDTKFWTSTGVKSFNDFQDGDNVIIRGKNKWNKATIKSFGNQDIWELKIQRKSTIQDIYTTDNHRWIVKCKKGSKNYNFKIKTTQELEKGWKIQTYAKRTNFHMMELCPVGLQHGIVYGDGTYNKHANTCWIQLCGKKKELSKYFYSERRDNDTITGLPNFWKKLPSLTANKDYLYGFMAGVFATDGSISESSCLTLTNSDLSVIEWYRTALFTLDILSSTPNISRETCPYTGEYRPSYRIYIYRDNIPDKFFVRSDQKERFHPKQEKNDWRVVSVTKTTRNEPVWCVVEPEHEEFTLENGILTKNCASTDTAKDFVLSAEWTMDALMNGVGVGFTTYWRGKVTRPNKRRYETFVVPDSREGWVQSLIKLLCSYIDSPKYGKNRFPHFDYSQIRPSGQPIKGFGGTASGYEPLKKMHERIEGYLDAFCDGYIETDGVEKEYNHTRLVTDIFNSIGACVVAGNVRRCLPGDSMVFTRTGMKPIKDIHIGEQVLTSKGYEKVTNKFEQGVQKLVKIITQDGDFRCTPNHRMAVCTSYDNYEWKTADSLQKGDRLLSSRMELEGIKTYLPQWSYNKTKHSTTCKDICVPELDSDMAWLIGLFHGDGYTYPNYDKNGFNAYVSIVVGIDEYDIAEKAQQQLQRFGNELHVTLRKRKNENSFIVHCQSKQLAWYFAKNVKLAKTEIRIPDYIRFATTDIKLAYIAGVADADGSLKNRPIQVVTTVYENFARDLQNLLYSCGMESRMVICSDEWESRKDWQRVYKLNLITKRSQQLFSEIPELYKEVRRTSRSQNANGFPCEFETIPSIKTKYGLYSNKQFNIDSYDRQYGEKWFAPVEVLDIVEDNHEETYDIEVENIHEFFCNGYLTHNSAQICLGDVDDETFVNLKNYDMNPERAEIGWMSNNSVVLKEGYDFENFTHIPELANRIRDNGEPGIINLYNIQKFGRYGKEMKDNASLVNPCSEIPLESMELCNLSETFPPRCDNPERFYEALKFATFYSSTVSLLPTHRPESNAVIARNRRIGVSISGIAQWAGMKNEHWGHMNYTKMTNYLRNGYRLVRKENTELAEEAGVPKSVRVTTVKPSGSISLLAGVTPGVHYPVSRYAIRRVRIGHDSPLVKPLIECGVPHEKDTYSDNTLVFEFVIDHGNVRPCEEVSPWEQFSLMAMMQRCWTDNCVSATVYFDKEKDGPDVEKMLAMYIPVLKSVSMLPHSGHGYAQAPYEPIDKQTYEQRLSNATMIDFSAVTGNIPEGSKYCTSDRCELAHK